MVYTARERGSVEQFFVYKIQQQTPTSHHYKPSDPNKVTALPTKQPQMENKVGPRVVGTEEGVKLNENSILMT